MDKSNYYNTLPKEVQERYLAKLVLTNTVDPYLLKFSQCSTILKDFPRVSFFDIINYLVFKKSAYSEKEFRAYKSLDAYNFFICKWVKKLAVKPISNSDRILIISQVMHSQRLNLPPLNVWVVAVKDGQILSAHCDCVAGLGEACSHVGATLFSVEDAARNYSEASVTDTKAYWMPPSARLGAPSKVSQVDYTVHPSKILDVTEEDLEGDSSLDLPEPSKEDKCRFLDALFALDKPSAVLSMFQPYADQLHEAAASGSKGLLGNLFSEENAHLSLQELINQGKNIDCSVNVTEVEALTRKQAQCKVWFSYRRGRITASNLKAVCHTQIEQPSVSLLKRICYPHEARFKSVYTQYGCDHEKKAVNDFVQNYLKSTHTNLEVSKVGLLIDENSPCLGASPDLMVSCDCCGKGCIEIKCPYCVKDTTIEEIIKRKQSFLKHNETEFIHGGDSSFCLDNKHTYYYQVQMQMGISTTKYCYFVAWTAKNIFYEKITFNDEFWSEKKAKAILFHENVVMPELLGKHFTKKQRSQTQVESQPGTSQSQTSQEIVDKLPGKTLWCTCKMPESGRKMVMCSNYFCNIKWFHLSCVKLKVVPKGIWHCKTCESVNFNKNK